MNHEKAPIPNSQKLIEDRLTEAKQMRQRAGQIRTSLIEIERLFPRKRRPRHAARQEYQKKLEQFFFQWVSTDEARAPDPRTGKSNEKWRERVWRNAVMNDLELQALRAETEKEKPGEKDARSEADALQTELIYLQHSMDLLTAELIALAKAQ